MFCLLGLASKNISPNIGDENSITVISLSFNLIESKNISPNIGDENNPSLSAIPISLASKNISPNIGDENTTA